MNGNGVNHETALFIGGAAVRLIGPVVGTLRKCGRLECQDAAHDEGDASSILA